VLYAIHIQIDYLTRKVATETALGVC